MAIALMLTNVKRAKDVTDLCVDLTLMITAMILVVMQKKVKMMTNLVIMVLVVRCGGF